MAELGKIGVKIAQLRRSRGLTQEELGKHVSVSAQAVSKWEKGDSLPDLSIIVELADIFDCSTDYLLGRKGGLRSLLPQIREAFVNMTIEDKIGFLGDIITAAEVSILAPPVGAHPSMVHIHLGPAGIGLWAKDRLVCIATTTFLNEAVETLEKEAEFPLTLLPDEIRLVLLALLRDMDDLKPDYAVDEKTLQSLLPNTLNFDHILVKCIELGFVDRVRGGYRLNFKADLAVRLLAILHQTINKQGTMNVTVGKPK
ncbi:helix-turn-helix transcriptional regulator [Paenibacillus aurantius]|uniref:Helix-turn-helix transcriptional regulator n=1 Tax=Paenibacillus aurantius TaxID=2918900 RepID=A0AA96LIG8_9BACL|nr:helix-turn-helix transcriptional regulator [Paenibacillus aurantius]WNQ13924.1 helix-turn-helix transcriptional regulator [Paenibacillus aurantius]